MHSTGSANEQKHHPSHTYGICCVNMRRGYRYSWAQYDRFEIKISFIPMKYQIRSRDTLTTIGTEEKSRQAE